MFEARLRPGLICGEARLGLTWVVTTLGRPGLTWAGWEMTTPDTGSPDRGTDTEARAMEVTGPDRLVIGDTTGLFWLKNILLGWAPVA